MSFIGRNRTEGQDDKTNQEETNAYIDKNTEYEICEFNDECDVCGNPNHKQSWAKMCGFPEEVDYYICEECILKQMVDK